MGKEEKSADAGETKGVVWRNEQELKDTIITTRETAKAVGEMKSQLEGLAGLSAKFEEFVESQKKTPEKPKPPEGEPTIKDLMELVARQGTDINEKVDAVTKDTQGRFDAMNRAGDFEKAIAKAGIKDPRQRAFLDDAFKGAAPKDVDAWVTDKVKLLGTEPAPAEPTTRATPLDPNRPNLDSGQPVSAMNDKLPANPMQLTHDQVASMTEDEMVQHYQAYSGSRNSNPFADKALGPLDGGDAGALLVKALEAAKQ